MRHLEVEHNRFYSLIYKLILELLENIKWFDVHPCPSLV